MTAEEYANNLVNKIDKSSYSQNKKNKFPHFDANDLADAFDAGQEEMKKKAIETIKVAYKNALYESEHNKGSYRSPIYIFEDLMSNCDELLNK